MESVVQIADAVAAGRVKAAAVLDEHRARYRETAKRLNALVQPRHALAGAEALQLDSMPSDSKTGQLLAGVPISIKECFPVSGLLTTLGIAQRHSGSNPDAIDREDAWLVTRLKKAGAIVVGKANVPQAMFLHETVNPVWGRTLHPLAIDRGPGGSSGGDAALVAAGVVPLAVGNDLAGSIRQPAHACGIVGIVPRTATLGDGGAFQIMHKLEVVWPRAGFLARHVDDLARALAAVGAIGCEAAGAAIENQPSHLRIAFWLDSGPLEPSAAVQRAVLEAVACLEHAGARATRLDGALAHAAAWTHLGILSADGGADVRKLFAGSRPIPPVARLLRLASLPQSMRPLLAETVKFFGRRIEAESLRATGPRRGAALKLLFQTRQEIATQFVELASHYDAIVCPVSALPALRHGTASRLVVAAAPCWLANLLDLAAGSVPVTHVGPEEEHGRGFSWDPVVRAARQTDRGSCGLPIGVQVVGLETEPGRGEATVLNVMRIIERGRKN